MHKSKNQIQDWLEKLERESWQLELLVSAFTIFLLIQASVSFDNFMLDLQMRYNLSPAGLALLFMFLVILQKSLSALTICLVGHLLLRGFWIGTIGLRSVQSTINFEQLNYSPFFTKRLKKKVISLDQMVTKLDEICSVIFSFAFLVISILVAFGLYFCFLGIIGLLLNSISSFIPESVFWLYVIVVSVLISVILISGIIYMIDYLTLGFFKKINWLAKIYYPFYLLYNVITLAPLTRSIYYYMISKFTKRKIRMLYLVIFGGVCVFALIDFDQYQYFPGNESSGYFVTANAYDDQRVDTYVMKASIASRFISGHFMPLFLRYDPKDNQWIRMQCPDFEPLKSDGLNWKYAAERKGGNIQITNPDYSNEDIKKLLDCQSSIYRVSINDSVYNQLSFHFYIHPAKEQHGLLTVIPTDGFLIGENRIQIESIRYNADEEQQLVQLIEIPFWFSAD